MCFVAFIFIFYISFVIVAIDIGNSSTTFGIFNKDGDLVFKFYIPTQVNRKVDEYYELFLSNMLIFINESVDRIIKQLKAFIISSVVPEIDSTFESFVVNCISKPYMFVVHNNHNLRIMIDDPAEIGADLVCNALGALTHYKDNCIIVDCGTATTFTAIHKEHRAIIGVIIAPGIQSSLKGLVTNTSKLIEVEIKKPIDGILQFNTVSAMQSGLYYGFIATISGILKHIKKTLPFDPKIIITGGFAKLMETAKDMNCFDEIDIDLTIKGLYQIYLLNKNLLQ